jgi:hypothetical protein
MYQKIKSNWQKKFRVFDMKKGMVILGILILVAFLLIKFIAVPPRLDPALSAAVSQFVAEEYGGFTQHSNAGNKEAGQAYFMKPTRDYGTEITVYGVLRHEEMDQIEAAAKNAFKKFPRARSITLTYFKSQNWEEDGSGSKHRGAELRLKQIKLLNDSAVH